MLLFLFNAIGYRFHTVFKHAQTLVPILLVFLSLSLSFCPHRHWLIFLSPLMLLNCQRLGTDLLTAYKLVRCNYILKIVLNQSHTIT